MTDEGGAPGESEEERIDRELIELLNESAFLIAPSAQHRILFRQREKRNLLRMANSLAIAGMGFLALAIVGVLWYGLPLRRR